MQEAQSTNNIIPATFATHECTHIPKCRDWQEIISHWKDVCPENILIIPLKDTSFKAINATRKIWSKYSDSKRFAEEYEEIGEYSLMQKYSFDRITLSELRRSSGQQRTNLYVQISNNDE